MNSIRFGKITTDRTVADLDLWLRPDIVVEEDDCVIIIDVTCPVDNDTDALSDAALAKVRNYQLLKEFVQSQGKSCEVFPFVVGALGSWYKKNELLLTKLVMMRWYKSLFCKLCCTDAIQGPMTFTGSTLDVMIASLVPLFRMHCVSMYVCMCVLSGCGALRSLLCRERSLLFAT